MTQQHPITPPPELVQQWRAAASNVPATLSTDSGGRRDYIDFIATQAAQWGADRELEACLERILNTCDADALRAARRPKPTSLKEQALLALSHLLDGAAHSMDTTEPANYIRRALEQLDD